MKDLIRGAAAEGAAVIVSSHLLSLFEDLVTTVLILHHGHLLRFGRLADLRNELAASGRRETLEELFFRLTESTPYDHPPPANGAPWQDAAHPPHTPSEQGPSV